MQLDSMFSFDIDTALGFPELPDVNNIQKVSFFLGQFYLKLLSTFLLLSDFKYINPSV